MMLKTRLYTALIYCAVMFFIAKVAAAQTTLHEKNQFVLMGKMERHIYDTLSLHVWNDIVSYDLIYHEPHRVIKIPVKDNAFKVVVDSITDFSIVSLSQGYHNGRPIPLFYQYYLSKGDSVVVNIGLKNKIPQYKRNDNGKPVYSCNLSFSGRGFQKLQCKYELDSVYLAALKSTNPGNINYDKWSLDSLSLRRADKLAAIELQYLSRYKSRLDPDVYQTLKADILGRDAYVFTIKNLLLYERRYRDNPVYLERLQNFLKESKTIKELETMEDSEAALRSALFIQTLAEKARVEQALFPDSVSAYGRLKCVANPNLRSKVITNYLLRNYVRLPNDVSQQYLKDALTYVDHKVYRQLLTRLSHGDDGKKIPPIILYDMEGKPVNLNSFAGKVLFIDFFYTGCSNCAQYFKKTVSKAEAHYKDNQDVIFISISIDGNKEKWINSVKSGVYTSMDVVNLFTGGLGAGHPVIKYFNITGYPKPILIDRNSRIVTTDFRELGRLDPQALIKNIDKILK